MSQNKNDIIIIDSDEEDHKPTTPLQNNQKSNKPDTFINNSNYNNRKYTNNSNSNSNSNKNSNNSIGNSSSSKTNNSNSPKNISKSNLPKYNSEHRRKFLAEIHEKRLGIGKSIQCIEIDEDFFSDNNNIDDINNKYIVKEENSNINKPATTTKTSALPIPTTTTTTTTTTNLNKNNVNNYSTNNNVNKSTTNTPFDFQASLKLRKEIDSIRNSRHQSYRNNKLGQKKMYSLDDIEQLKKDENNQRIIAASMDTTIKPPSHGVHTIDNTLQHPEAIGRKALELTNTFRKTLNLPPLLWNQPVYLVGVEHSKNMGEKIEEFGHGGFKERVKKFPFKFKSVGENVAYTNSSNVAEHAVDGWINSPGHRKNLVGNFNVCSIGVYKNSEGFWYLTQLFALCS
ncbi:hypothetical protein DICPUDRAFT_148783 [Dictyostelium purpureum]|uniref:SCP domain-containing protein n=1 Tax=Dictyostelium purpureum TaxID=5786 RepID=F0ZBZ8_DICPU|nr:uncharacterized protein DICPUDRAFT_148783 [Dictyostelium purpureum]EGC38575.1 hypothetical protein DICPUDRAFT_148783 [Dictyostelium purpureum]|eukprot:XP_003284946.1 hypothetical protein DICPUDRAFT_148783 [Dictyostelium purpureum]